jgi:hypothetical protein
MGGNASAGAVKRKKGSSFLKKRSKKLLAVGCRVAGEVGAI